MGLADLHIHTIHSYDGTASAAAVLKRAAWIGLDVIAITDHDEIKGALQAPDLASTYVADVIPGAEVTTAEGDLLALNIRNNIQRGMALVDTILKVGDQGGFCIAPHPMAGGMGMKSLSAYSILKALRNPQAAAVLIGMETLVFSGMVLGLLVVLAVDTLQKRSRYLNGDEPDAQSDHR